MGTRHLVAVVLDQKPRIAQYGQWDGYPTGQGKAVLRFLDRMDRPKFEKALRASSFLTQEQLEALDDANWRKTHPHLSRDLGAEILDAVQNSEGLQLKNSWDFAADSLFCEWAYVIDLDENRLEVYEGFNKKPLPETDRFASMPKQARTSGEYYPVRLVKAYPLDALPTLEVLEADCVKEEAEA